MTLMSNPQNGDTQPPVGGNQTTAQGQRYPYYQYGQGSPYLQTYYTGAQKPRQYITTQPVQQVRPVQPYQQQQQQQQVRQPVNIHQTGYGRDFNDSYDMSDEEDLEGESSDQEFEDDDDVAMEDVTRPTSRRPVQQHVQYQTLAQSEDTNYRNTGQYRMYTRVYGQQRGLVHYSDTDDSDEEMDDHYSRSRPLYQQYSKYLDQEDDEFVSAAPLSAFSSSPKDEDLDDENFFEPIDFNYHGVYKVRDYEEGVAKFRWRCTNVDNDQARKGRYSEVFYVDGQPFRFFVFPRGNYQHYVGCYLDVAIDQFKLDHPELPYRPSTQAEHDKYKRNIRFSISLLNIRDVRKSVWKDTSKEFTFSANDWGFGELVPLEKVYGSGYGYSRFPRYQTEWYLPEDNGTIFFEMVVQVQRDPFIIYGSHYSSKSLTGFVGLRNQGATCYMNSLLYSWFHISYLRKAVYKMPIGDDEKPTDSIPLALQRLFWRMQYDDNSADTRELTKSFGWTTMDAFMQHDVQELARVLTENLEKKMDKVDSVKGTMARLFEGKLKNYIRCLNVDYESSRIETFYDLQLDVKGCKDVYESFDRYVYDEILSGDNQYRAEGHGLQDAKKGCIFKKLPPVLTLHLKRFEYDMIRDMQVKINDHYVFPAILDLNKYIDPTPEPAPAAAASAPDAGSAAASTASAPASDDTNAKMEDDSSNGYSSEQYSAAEELAREPSEDDNRFVLLSVLVHQGDVSGGHYYAFVSPDPHTRQWYKFDDEKVLKVRDADAIADNYGGEAEKRTKFFWLNPHSTPSAYRKYTNAYMLVYIQKSRIDEILTPVRDEDVPKHLHDRFAREEEENERKKKEEQEASRYASIRIITYEDLSRITNTIGFGSLESIEPLRVPKDTKLGDFKEQLAQTKFQVPASRVKLVAWSTGRPEQIIPAECEVEDFTRLFKLPYRNSVNKVIEIFAYVGPEYAAPAAAPAGTEETAATEPAEYTEQSELQDQLYVPALVTSTEEETAVVFFKFYDPEQKLLSFAGLGTFPTSTIVGDLKPFARSLVNLPDNVDILFNYEYLGSGHCPYCGFLQPTHTLHAVDKKADVFIVAFQSFIDKDRIQPLYERDSISGLQPSVDENMQCLLIKDFYQYLIHRVTVKFAPLEDPDNVTHEIELLKVFTYEQVQRVLAKHLQQKYDEPVQAECIRLTGVNPFSKEPRPEAFRIRDTKQLRNMLQVTIHTEPTDKLFYEILEMPLREIETKKELNIVWYNDQVKDVMKIRLVVDPNISVEHICDVLLRSKLAEKGIYPYRPIRLLHVEKENHKIRATFANSVHAKELPPIGELRAEELAQDLFDFENEKKDLAAYNRLLYLRHQLVNIVHFCRESGGLRTFGAPFVMACALDEKFAALRDRIQAKLQVPEEEFSKYKFAMLTGLQKHDYLKDDDVVIAELEKYSQGGKFSVSVVLGMEHKDPAPPKKVTSSSREKGISINNYSSLG